MSYAQNPRRRHAPIYPHAQTLRALTDETRAGDPLAALSRHAMFLSHAFHTLLCDSLSADGGVDDAGAAIALRTQQSCRRTIAILSELRRLGIPILKESHDNRTD